VGSISSRLLHGRCVVGACVHKRSLRGCLGGGGGEFLAPPYYSQHTVFASPLSAFFIILLTLVLSSPINVRCYTFVFHVNNDVTRNVKHEYYCRECRYFLSFYFLVFSMLKDVYCCMRIFNMQSKNERSAFFATLNNQLWKGRKVLE